MKSGNFSSFKRRALYAALASVVLGGAGLVGSVHAEDGTGTATATVVRPITVSNSTTSLRFGAFSTSASGQTVVIAPGGGRNLTGALGVGTSQIAFGAASFTVTGEGSLTYAITLPSTPQTIITDDGGSANEVLTLTSFTSNPSSTGTLSGSLGTEGTQTLTVGATLTTAASQVTGAYTGTFAVSVDYN